MSLSFLTLIAAGTMTPVQQNDFARVLWTNTKASAGQNMVVSPLSAQLALSLLANASAGNTQKAVFSTLQTPSTDLGAFNLYWSSLSHELQSGGFLQIANATFTAPDLRVSDDYKKRVTEKLHASHYKLKGFGEVGAGQINAWVKEHTKNRIEKLFETLSPSEKSILVNAITFDGRWDVPFVEAKTTSKSFKSSRGVQSVPMMKRTGFMAYGQNSRCNFVRLDYKDSPFSMVVMLPKGLSSPDKILRNFDGAAIDAALLGSGSEVDLELPKFEIKSEPPIEQALKKMGLAPLFAHADFRPMVPSGEMGALGRIVQKTYIKVDESGTKAAAATGITMTRAMRFPSKPIEFHVNRPFAFAIIDKKSKTVAFMGSIQRI